MKTTKEIIIVVNIIFCCSFCIAQRANPTPAQWLAYQQKEIKECPYIFEGNVTQQKCFFGLHGMMICSVIQITKIYRGSPQLKIGTIKVITNQNKGYKDAGPDVGIGRYVIFGNPSIPFIRIPADSNVFQSMPTDNILILACNDWISFTGNGASWEFAQYKTTDSLYSFFKENGLTVQEEEK